MHYTDLWKNETWSSCKVLNVYTDELCMDHFQPFCPSFISLEGLWSNPSALSVFLLPYLLQTTWLLSTSREEGDERDLQGCCTVASAFPFFFFVSMLILVWVGPRPRVSLSFRGGTFGAFPFSCFPCPLTMTFSQENIIHRPSHHTYHSTSNSILSPRCSCLMW